MPPPSVQLIYLDADLIVVNKPAGLLAVPGRTSTDDLSSQMAAVYPNCRPVHRLDQATSGLMLFARCKLVLTQLSSQFERRSVDKRYIAIAAGRLQSQFGDIVLPLSCDWPNRPRQQVDFHQGRSAHTRFERLAYVGDQTRLALYPITGRSHQLRVHCQALGHPLVGDEFYQGPPASRLMLHAEFLEVTHPTTAARIRFSCPPAF